MKKLGVIVNPVAGLGGRLGLKGSDGAHIQAEAIKMGAVAEAPARVIEALKHIVPLKNELELIAFSHEMGEDEARQCGFDPVVIGSIRRGASTSNDTFKAVQEMERLDVDLIMFAGGDGTARDIYSATNGKVPFVGVPAGVKIHSGVYAINPGCAGEVAARYLEGKLEKVREAEVMDIDEDAFRSGRVVAKLFGYLRIPEERRYIQCVKAGGIQTEKEALVGIADGLIEEMNADRIYIVGPGTTTRVIFDRLDLPKTLLGVDVLHNRQLIQSDVSENQLLELLAARQAIVIVTVIGGQGHIFGRGNQQISPRIIRKVGKDNIRVVTSVEKLTALNGRPLLVDTGDKEVDRMLTGYLRINTGYGEYAIYRVGYDLKTAPKGPAL